MRVFTIKRPATGTRAPWLLSLLVALAAGLSMGLMPTTASATPAGLSPAGVKGQALANTASGFTKRDVTPAHYRRYRKFRRYGYGFRRHYRPRHRFGYSRPYRKRWRHHRLNRSYGRHHIPRYGRHYW